MPPPAIVRPAPSAHVGTAKPRTVIDSKPVNDQVTKKQPIVRQRSPVPSDHSEDEIVPPKKS